MTQERIFTVRVGDDGRTHLTTTDSLEARRFAAKLSNEGWAQKAEIKVNGRREATYRSGRVSWTSRQWEGLL